MKNDSRPLVANETGEAFASVIMELMKYFLGIMIRVLGLVKKDH